MIRVSHDQILALLDADWRSPGPISLNRSLTLDELSGSLVLRNGRRVMAQMEADNGIKLTAAGNFNRKFVEQMVREFDWPGFEEAFMRRYHKVFNEPDFVPLNYLHVLIGVAGLGRRYRGRFRLTRLGRSLLAPEAAGELNAVLFEATFHRYNLAYLDRYPETAALQQQIGLTLFLLGLVANEARSPKDLLAMTTLPIDTPPLPDWVPPESVYGIRVLRYLEWFGLLERRRKAANDELLEDPDYRKTPLFERFLSFHVEAQIS